MLEIASVSIAVGVATFLVLRTVFMRTSLPDGVAFSARQAHTMAIRHGVPIAVIIGITLSLVYLRR